MSHSGGFIPIVAVYLLVALIVFAGRSGLHTMVIPAEAAALFAGAAGGGALAPAVDVPIPAMIAVVLLSGLAASAAGYTAGHRLGPPALGWRVLIVRRERLLQAHRYLAHSVRSALFLGPFTGFRRQVMPALAGINALPYRRFLAWTGLGTATWTLLFVGLGTLASRHAQGITRITAGVFLLAVLSLVAADFTVWRLRTR
ncbi:DedA family protein [Streptomyces carpaticus]|uniref:DedA family protein n=1 Tax=Streptomyces carpaticus TaxID=285558 RepID=A0ABV4ZMT8_9ACTN